MSTFRDFPYTCSVCGEESTFRVCTSSICFGKPDLDYRPAILARYTVSSVIQECPNCGYAAVRVSEKEDFDRAILSSDEYKNCGNMGFTSIPAQQNFRHHLIQKSMGNTFEASRSMLRAAWLCDDEGDDVNSVACRKMAIELLDDSIARGLIPVDLLERSLLIKCDMMRRAGLFDELISEYSSPNRPVPLPENVISFQIEAAKRGDTARYTFEDVEKEEQ